MGRVILMANLTEAFNKFAKALSELVQSIWATIKKAMNVYLDYVHNKKVDKRMDYLRMALRATKKTTQRRRLERNLREAERMYRR
jgi:cell division GTPase FtsZ